MSRRSFILSLFVFVLLPLGLFSISYLIFYPMVLQHINSTEFELNRQISLAYQYLSVNSSYTKLFDKSAEHHILVLGNSITKHPQKESIGWNSDWGMAASCEENDFCHQLENMLRECNEKTDITPVNAAFWERDYALIDSISTICGGGMTQ